MALEKKEIERLLKIDNLEKFMEKLSKILPDEKLVPKYIGPELTKHWRRLLWGGNPETAEEHTDPRWAFDRPQKEVGK